MRSEGAMASTATWCQPLSRLDLARQVLDHAVDVLDEEYAGQHLLADLRGVVA